MSIRSCATQLCSRALAWPQASSSGAAAALSGLMSSAPLPWPLALSLSPQQQQRRALATAPPSDPFQEKLQSRTEQELLQLIAKQQAASTTGGEAGAAADEDDDMVDVVNHETGERYGPRGKEPTRFGDWESKGRCTDFQ